MYIYIYIYICDLCVCVCVCVYTCMYIIIEAKKQLPISVPSNILLFTKALYHLYATHEVHNLLDEKKYSINNNK